MKIHLQGVRFLVSCPVMTKEQTLFKPGTCPIPNVMDGPPLTCRTVGNTGPFSLNPEFGYLSDRL